MPDRKPRTPVRDPAQAAKRIGPALPHERDEAMQAPPPPGRKMRQAAADVAAGKVDTEARSAARCNFEPATCVPPKRPHDAK